jgi:hypothetical protein
VAVQPVEISHLRHHFQCAVIAAHQDVLAIVENGAGLGFPVAVGPAAELGLGFNQIHEVALAGEGEGGGATGITSADHGDPGGGTAGGELLFETLLAAAQGHEFFPAGKLDGSLEHLKVSPANLFQEVTVDTGHEQGGGEVRAIRLREETIGFFKVVAGAEILHPQEPGHAWGRVRPAKILLRHPEGFPLLAGQVDATEALEVVGHVPKDVGQLKGHSEGDGVVAGCAGLAAEDVDRNEADSRSDAVAVFAEIFEGVVAVLGQVHFHSVEDFEEGFGRDEVLADDRGELFG